MLFFALCFAVEPSLRTQQFMMSVCSCMHSDSGYGGTNPVLRHISVAGCLWLGFGCCGFRPIQRMQLSYIYTDIRAWTAPRLTGINELCVGPSGGVDRSGGFVAAPCPHQCRMVPHVRAYLARSWQPPSAQAQIHVRHENAMIKTNSADAELTCTAIANDKFHFIVEIHLVSLLHA